jgi:hypothetical protein
MGDHERGSGPRSRPSSATRDPRTAAPARNRAIALVSRPRFWVSNGDGRSLCAVGPSWWRRYRAIDGPLQSLLLTTYIFLAILPAVLVLAEYFQRNPAALANHLISHYHLTGSAARNLREILVGDRRHELGSAIFAIAGVLVFGLGFGRVLQLVYARAWGIESRERASDQIRYAAVLLVLLGLVVLLFVQTSMVTERVAWGGAASAPLWLILLSGYFLWAPRYLLRGALGFRELRASSVLTAVGIVILMFVSGVAMAPWIDLYAADFAGLGVFMGLFFWLALSSTVIVTFASISPVLAGRRRSLAEKTSRPQDQGVGESSDRVHPESPM